MSFEDMIWLFTSNETTRGIARLNIAEGALLYKYCKKVSSGVLVEIGRKYGGSTVLMSSSLVQGHLYSIDIVEHQCVYEYTKSYKDKITFITGDSKMVEWDIPIDLIFIDGDHSYEGVKNDIKKFTPHIKKNGYVIFHDVVGKKSILQPLIDKLLKKGWVDIDKIDSMLILQNKNKLPILG